ncbi:MAG TPA: hypothetical protein VL172_04815, partial [Kofleriaceae bacterium]|nr:hypothetical protein [Kofleriaceae bacterium]
AVLTEQAADEARRAAAWPWETLGVPLSVVSFDAKFRPAFADRGAVVRQGGGRHNRSALVPLSGDDVLWQARVSQLLEHLAELPADQRQAEALARQFDWLPPAGVLPLEVADFERGRQTLFPPSYDVQAQPIPLDMVDALIAESSALLPFNLSLRDQVQLLVPVPARYYDPDLLKLDERVHPLFDLEIARLERERQLLLSRRDGLRRRYDTLLRSVTGELPGYTPDDPNALPDEAGALDALAFTRIHKSSVAPGQGDLHQFTAAHATLQFHATDELVFFVRIDQPVAGIGVRPLISTPGAPGTAPIVWGSMGGVAGRFNRVGDLPPPGQWARLSVPISRTALGGQKIDGFAFATFGGRAAGEVSWGHVGKVSDGLEFYWVTDALPPGAVADGNWTWEIQGAPFTAEEDAAAGLPIEPAAAANPAPPGAHPHARHVSELERLVASWKNYKGGVLMAELGEPVNRPADAQTPPRPEEAGLDELIARLDARIRTAGDHIDFGFLRARTDIFRMRQTVLGTDEASRLLTSPAGSELIDRSNNAVASEKAFADYFGKLNEKVKAPPIFKSPAPAPAPGGGVPRLAPAVRSDSGSGGLNLRLNNALFRAPSGFTGIAAPAETMTTTEVRAAVGGVSGARLVDARVELKTARISLDNLRARPLSTEPPPAVKDVIGSSLLGATYNSVTVAERFTAPPSVLSSNAAAKGKGDFVKTGIDLLQASGLVIDDLPVFGYQLKGAPSEEAKKVTAGDLLKRG